ncbi:hypothetical protein [Streptomyces sp. NPDC059009]
MFSIKHRAPLKREQSLSEHTRSLKVAEDKAKAAAVAVPECE